MADDGLAGFVVGDRGCSPFTMSVAIDSSVAPDEARGGSEDMFPVEKGAEDGLDIFCFSSGDETSLCCSSNSHQLNHG